MTVELPPALRAAIDRELSGASRRDLADRTAATTEAYRAGRGSASVIKGRDDALAYALVRLPATYAACATVFFGPLPKTPAGEVLRPVLRRIAETGDAGDTSGLDDPAVAAALVKLRAEALA